MSPQKAKNAELNAAMETLGTRQAAHAAPGEVSEALLEVAAKSQEAADEDREAGQSFIGTVNRVLAVSALVAFLVVFFVAQPWDDAESAPRRAVGAAIPAALLIFTLVGAMRAGQGGLLAWVRGRDGRLSTSLTQVALWTIAIGTALLYFICLDYFSSEPENSFTATVGSKAELPEAYLLLLGGPFAAAVLSRFVVSQKVDSGQVQKVESDSARLRDLVSDDAGNASLVDAQFLVFNVVALFWFVGALIESPRVLPEMPLLLLGLTGVSALGYVGAKAAESNRPTIGSMTLYRELARGNAAQAVGAAIRPGDLVEIRGTGFVPPGADALHLLHRIVVRFGDVDVTPQMIRESARRWRSPSDGLIVAEVPRTTTPGPIDVVVITAAGAESDSRKLTVTEDKPILTGVQPTHVVAGQEVTLYGRYFHQARADMTELPSVRFGDVTRLADSVAEGFLKVGVPPEVEGVVLVTVIAPGSLVASAAVPLSVAKP